MITQWIVMHNFARFDLKTQQWINDHKAEYEFYTDEYGNPTHSTGNSRIVPK